MTTFYEFKDYFNRKISDWNTIQPHYNHLMYIRTRGKPGLVVEFRSDPSYEGTVCAYLSAYASGKEKDALSTVLKDALSLFEGDPIPAELDILIGAVLEACGYTNKGIGLLEIGLATLVIGAALSAIFFAGRRK
jgi:hypothetical protein